MNTPDVRNKNKNETTAKSSKNKDKITYNFPMDENEDPKNATQSRRTNFKSRLSFNKHQ
jgi:hypothetical protein